MHLVYFAHIREAIGADAEDYDLPDYIATIDDCLDWLCVQDSKYAAVFADRSKLRFAIDQEMAKSSASLSGVQELAIFPPVTGG